MGSLIRPWIMSLTGAGLLSAFALAMTPRGRVRSVISLLCGVVLALCFVSPLLEFDYEALARSLTVYRDSGESIAVSAIEINSQLERVIIEGQTATYILDKAQVMGLKLGEVSVTAKRGDEGLWYPHEVSITEAGEKLAAQEKLRDAITADIGIPPERQYWRE